MLVRVLGRSMACTNAFTLVKGARRTERVRERDLGGAGSGGSGIWGVRG
jgi:hypothetical protein